jgi:SagB-type dehydrogenase family enzyme
MRFASAVFGEPEPPPDDLAELYHDASRITGIAGVDELAGIGRLLASPELRAGSTRAVRRHLHAPLVSLDTSAELQMPLGDALARRRSVRSFAATPLGLPELAAIVRAGYGVTGRLKTEGEPQPVRSAPSGGALYPLELSVAVQRVDGLEPGLYHFDPLDDALEVAVLGCPGMAATTPFVEAAGTAAAVVIVSAVFWRSRFKYGLRGYRFVLLEAGHVAQNVLLAATSLGLGAVALGGFYDRRVDELIGVNGVDESTLYLICLGAPA